MKTVQELIEDLQALVETNPEAASYEVVAIYHDQDCVPLGEPQLGHRDEEHDFWDVNSIKEWNESPIYSDNPKSVDAVGI